MGARLLLSSFRSVAEVRMLSRTITSDLAGLSSGWTSVSSAIQESSFALQRQLGKGRKTYSTPSLAGVLGAIVMVKLVLDGVW